MVKDIYEEELANVHIHFKMKEENNMSKDILPLWFRRTLYVIGVLMLIAAPFVNLIADEATGNAFVSAASIIGGVIGVTALAHPTPPKTTPKHEA